MWRHSFEERRCLIPVTQFAQTEGEKGAKTRTWFSLPDQPVFAVAGSWRDTPEWGPACSMVMTEACIHVEGIHVEGIHDRMPVVLRPEDWTGWTRSTGRGGEGAVRALSRRDDRHSNSGVLGAAVERLSRLVQLVFDHTQ